MSDTHAKDQTHNPEVIEAAPVGLAVRETVGALQAPTFDRLAQLDEGMKVLERMGQLQEMLTVTLIRLTEPEDWVRSQTKDGQVSAMPTKAANLKMARFLGLEIRGVDGGSLSPELVHRGEQNNVRGYRVEFQVRCEKLGIDWRTLETTRWEDEDFTGRTVDAADKLVFRGEKALDSDLKSAAYSAAMNKATKEVSGLGKVPDGLLLRAWGKQEMVNRCQKGHGFGKASERAAESVAEAGSKEDAEALWAELLRMNNGDVAAAGATLEKITIQPDGKYAKKSVKAFTAGWQVKKAWERLEGLAEYKAYRSGSAAEREPGED